jgi:membrane protein
MSVTGEDDRVARLRVLASSIAERAGGVPAVRVLTAVLEVYDEAGGGLVAGGLAYSALVALLPGLLLVLSVFGLVVHDPAVQEQLVTAIAEAVPPLESLARTALEQVSAGAVPGSILAIAGLLWASSRFYAALDNAIARVFRHGRRRDEIRRTIRGVILTLLVIALPIAMVLAGSAASLLVDRLPDGGSPGILVGIALRLASPVGSVILFVAAAVAVFRFVPAERVPVGAWRLPAIVVGVLLAGFTQLFALFAPLMFRTAALYGAVVAVFALLAWLSIGFNMLLMGAAWTRVRVLALSDPGPTVDP